MKQFSRLLLFGALTLMLLTACAGQEESPTVVGPTSPAEETAFPPPVGTETTETATTATAATPDMTATSETAATTPATETAATSTTQTPGIPVTGSDVILLECQFCIEGAAHALLVIPDTTTFEVVGDTASLSTPGPDMGCNTVDTFNGRQVVICRGEENMSFNVNICTDGANCTQLLVELQTCAQLGATETPDGAINTPTLGATTATPLTTDTPEAATSTPTP